jgi:hypothetical protein
MVLGFQHSRHGALQRCVRQMEATVQVLPPTFDKNLQEKLECLKINYHFEVRKILGDSMAFLTNASSAFLLIQYISLVTDFGCKSFRHRRRKKKVIPKCGNDTK